MVADTEDEPGGPWLVVAGEADVKQISVAGEGSSMPLSEDPARNRRVEVRWVPAMQ